MAQLSGALPIAAVDVARAERVTFQPRGFPWVDPTKDIEALRQEIHLGLNSRTAAAAERGRDFEKMLEQLDAEVRLAAKYGVDVSGAEPAPPQIEEPFVPARGLRIANA
jgi:capsid protein